MAGLVLDAREENRAGLAGKATELDREGRVERGPGPAQGRNSRLDLSPFFFAETDEHLVVRSDQVAQCCYLALGGNVGRFGAGAERDRNLANLLAERLGEG